MKAAFKEPLPSVRSLTVFPNGSCWLHQLFLHPDHNVGMCWSHQPGPCRRLHLLRGKQFKTNPQQLSQPLSPPLKGSAVSLPHPSGMCYSSSLAHPPSRRGGGVSSGVARASLSKRPIWMGDRLEPGLRYYTPESKKLCRLPQSFG